MRHVYKIVVFALMVAGCTGFDLPAQTENQQDASTNLYVVSTLAGTGVSGASNGAGLDATFNSPCAVTLGPDGSPYILDWGNGIVRKMTIDGVDSTVSTYAGNGVCANATFSSLSDIAVDATGNIYIADSGNNMIYKIITSSSSCNVSILAGSGAAKDVDGTGSNAAFDGPEGLTVDASGNVYVTEWGGNKIRKVTPGGVVSTIAGNGTAGHIDGTGMGATFNEPTGIAVDTDGNLYVAEVGNNDIRKITPDGSVSTLAGSGIQALKDGIGTSAAFNQPFGLAIGPDGYLYVPDTTNNAVRKVSIPTGEVTTIAGSGEEGAADGPAGQATFNGPVGVTVDANGVIYVADQGNNKIRKITPVY
ncbi:MAG: NHL repeat-containing protein [Polyangiaceae bacterium]|nr:NHL repeat-containing protein [Polyangiaceae bacterium]